MKIFSFVIFAMLLFGPVAASAQLNVLMSGGFSGAYEQLLPEFERTSGIKVTTGSGASQGAGPQTIAAQLARGVPANVVILSREGLSELIAARGSPPEQTWILREYLSAWRCGRGLRSPT